MRSNFNLPEEILFEILSRVPPKSVGIFRCVSKPWRALLTRPEFMNAHFRQTQINPQHSLAIFDRMRSLCDIQLGNARQLFDETPLRLTKVADRPPVFECCSIVSSCRGLVFADKFVFNPITGEVREVPDHSYSYDDFFWEFGFGYDSVHDDYKAVIIAYYNSRPDLADVVDPDDFETFVEVFSLREGDWKMVESSPYDHSVAPGHNVFTNGFVHWLASSIPDDNATIVAFDVAEEKFGEVPPPPCLIGLKSCGSVDFYLAVLGGCLCVYDDTEKYFWLMKDYGVQGSWTKFTINDPSLQEVHPVCLLGQEAVVMWGWETGGSESEGDRKLMVHNVKEGTSKDITVHGIPKDEWSRVSFVENLVSPNAWW